MTRPPKVRDAIVAVFQKTGVAMTPKELEEYTGHTYTSIATAMTRRKDMFEKVDRGRYRLINANGNGANGASDKKKINVRDETGAVVHQLETLDGFVPADGRQVPNVKAVRRSMSLDSRIVQATNLLMPKGVPSEKTALFLQWVELSRALAE